MPQEQCFLPQTGPRYDRWTYSSHNQKGYQRKGAALFAMGKVSDAKYAYQKGITLAPLDQQLRAGLAQVLESEQGTLVNPGA